MTAPLFPGPDQVIVYQHSDRGGWRQTLEYGEYPTPLVFGAQDDSISAIDVGSNAHAVLYQASNLGGRQAHFDGGFYYDQIGSINDRTSSIEIFPMQGGPAATGYFSTTGTMSVPGLTAQDDDVSTITFTAIDWSVKFCPATLQLSETRISSVWGQPRTWPTVSRSPRQRCSCTSARWTSTCRGGPSSLSTHRGPR